MYQSTQCCASPLYVEDEGRMSWSRRWHPWCHGVQSRANSRSFSRLRDCKTDGNMGKPSHFTLSWTNTAKSPLKQKQEPSQAPFSRAAKRMQLQQIAYALCLSTETTIKASHTFCRPYLDWY